MNRKTTSNARRGFTVIELVITMALVVTISATAIGIVAISSRTVGYGENVLARITELRTTKSDITLWASSFDAAEYTVSVYADHLAVTNGDSENTAVCRIAEGILHITQKDSGEMSETEFTVIKSAEFALMESDKNGGLISCRITFTYESGEEVFGFVFCVRAAECIPGTNPPAEESPFDESSFDESTSEESSFNKSPSEESPSGEISIPDISDDESDFSE